MDSKTNVCLVAVLYSLFFSLLPSFSALVWIFPNCSLFVCFCLFVLVGDVEEMESDDEDDAAPMVTIGDRRLAYHDVTDEMVAMMTPAEKEEYIRIGQEMYENYYEWWQGLRKLGLPTSVLQC